MRKKRSKNKPITLARVFIKWLQLSADEAMTIAVWVLAWSIAEPYVMKLSIKERALMILLLILILQRNVTKILRQKKKKRG